MQPFCFNEDENFVNIIQIPFKIIVHKLAKFDKKSYNYKDI